MRRFTQIDPIGLRGGLNLYGFAGGDPVNFSDPFGLKVDMSKLNSAQKARIESLRARSTVFAEWFDLLDKPPASQLLVRVSNAVDEWVGFVQGYGDGYTSRYSNGRFITILFSSPENWLSDSEFESVAAHEFAHAAAGMPGGTPSICHNEKQRAAMEACGVLEQNRVHRQIGLRDRRDHGDGGPFEPSSPTRPEAGHPERP